MAGKKRTERVTVELDDAILRGVSAELARLRKSRPGKATRAAAVRSLLARQLRCAFTPSKERESVSKEILKEAGVLKTEGSALLAKGRLVEARKLLLAATVRELEALWVLGDPSEEALRSSLIEIVGLLKDATGYRHLPDVPRPRRAFAEPTV